MLRIGAMILAGIVLLPFTDFALAQGKICGTPGYEYPCPPKPPRGPRTRVENENFRIDLEKYRLGVEETRKKAPAQELETYREAIGEYERGIEDYLEHGPERGARDD